MLIQYAVENYKSIKDEIVISFRAEKKSENSKWVAGRVDKDAPIYKTIGLFGPNASGKSNIIESMLFAYKFIYKTISRKENEKISIPRFAFSDESKERPTSFEFIFYQNKTKYVYGFSVTPDEVVEEYLMGYFSSKPKTVFERTEGQKYEFKGNDTKIQSEISKKTNANRLYMPVAAEWGYEPLKIVREWFDDIIRHQLELNFNTMVSGIAKDERRKNILVRELRKADFNISDIYIKNKVIENNSRTFIDLLIKSLATDMEVNIPEEIAEVYIVHENKNGETYDISLFEDSTGTIDIVKDIVELLYIENTGGVMLKDELGSSYHTKLAQHFLNLFKSDNINDNVQILYASHDAKLLNMMNSDQVYLVDKDENGATFVKLLSDYQIRPDTNVELGYLKGRFGGIPYMRG